MSMPFTSEEISRARRLVKMAGTRPPNIDAAIQSLMGPGSYDTWLGPKSRIEPDNSPRPGFWSSLGRSALGAVDKVTGPIRGFVGLAPGTSGFRTIANAAPRWAWNKFTGDQAGADYQAQMMREGLVIPTRNAYAQSNPYHYALSNWANSQHPWLTDKLTHPFRTIKDVVTAEPPRQRFIEQPTPAWWQQ